MQQFTTMFTTMGPGIVWRAEAGSGQLFQGRAGRIDGNGLVAKRAEPGTRDLAQAFLMLNHENPCLSGDGALTFSSAGIVLPAGAGIFSSGR